MIQKFKWKVFSKSETGNQVSMNKSRTPIHSGTFKKAVKDELVKKKDISEDLNSLIPKIMNNHNLDTQIKNKVQEIMEKNRYFKDNITVAKNQFKDCVDCSFLPAFYKEKDFEPLESVANAKKIWNEQIKYKANVVARTVRKPFISAKAKGGKDVPEVPPIDLKEVDDPSCMFIFDQNTLFDSVLKVNSINYAGVMNLTWGSVKLQLQTMSVKEMRKKFNELNVTLRQIGVDDEKSFIDERLLQGDKLLSKDFRPLLINYARRGVPPSLRCRVYKKIFNIEMNPRDYEYYKSLNDHFSKWDLCIDDICNFDTNEVINDEKYFIFQDFIVQVTNLFFRDTWVLENMRSKPHATLTAIIGLDKEVGPFPPNGVLPCKHFSKFVCPFCYISTSPEDIYFIFRAFYAKYICQLHSLNSDSQGIIGL